MEDLLAIKLRPKTLNEVLGQSHLIGKDKVLTNLVKNKKLFSMILYGKPGTGKTSIAIALVSDLNINYRMLNAVINNKKDFDIVVEEAKMNNGIVLIMDEIHRMNKDKQDLLLPYLESGLITLIGMTTSNPYHSINMAIRSRCQLFEVKQIEDNDIKKAINYLIKSNLLPNLSIEKTAINYIIKTSSQDLRYVYNLIEVCYYSNSDKNLTLEKVINLNSSNNRSYDIDTYYDLISALQKSIRGSDVNASIYYLARLLDSNDLDSITRRLAVIVYEDIGLANPNMGPRVMAAINSALLLGLPEARIPLSEIVIELALSPKSNSAEIAIDKALNDLNKGLIFDIPKHIKNSSPNYLYPHNYKNSYIKQQYLPDKIKDNTYYFPRNNKNEIILKEIMDNLNKIS